MEKEMIKKVKDKLVITIPLKTRRRNPYDPDYSAEMDNIIGLIEGENEMGFCFRIDMEYKNKGDQWSDYFFKWFGDREEFEKICQEIGIDVIIDWKDKLDIKGRFK